MELKCWALIAAREVSVATDSWRGASVIVSGGAGGLGEATVRRLSAEGWFCSEVGGTGTSCVGASKGYGFRSLEVDAC
jgi:hypothetical protein